MLPVNKEKMHLIEIEPKVSQMVATKNSKSNPINMFWKFQGKLEYNKKVKIDRKM